MPSNNMPSSFAQRRALVKKLLDNNAPVAEFRRALAGANEEERAALYRVLSPTRLMGKGSTLLGRSPKSPAALPRCCGNLTGIPGGKTILRSRRGVILKWGSMSALMHGGWNLLTSMCSLQKVKYISRLRTVFCVAASCAASVSGTCMRIRITLYEITLYHPEDLPRFLTYLIMIRCF